jgi:hypothetical protein
MYVSFLSRRKKEYFATWYDHLIAPTSGIGPQLRVNECEKFQTSSLNGYCNFHLMNILVYWCNVKRLAKTRGKCYFCHGLVGR